VLSGRAALGRPARIGLAPVSTLASSGTVPRVCGFSGAVGVAPPKLSADGVAFGARGFMVLGLLMRDGSPLC